MVVLCHVSCLCGVLYCTCVTLPQSVFSAVTQTGELVAPSEYLMVSSRDFLCCLQNVEIVYIVCRLVH